ncbi:MAG TPA: mechanosensitive ion channel domain-containing protein [Longimicrobiaceae bacterium]|nr:mechanosensitive ion channel domain-containing protein [Longimicrobiaceae bacterium]
MLQLPLPRADTTAIHVPLPSAWEHWRDAHLADVGTKLAAFVVLAALLYFVARIARRQASAAIEDVNRRHTLRKWINGGYAILVVLTGIALFADWLAGLGTVLALIVAGVAVALQDVLKSVVGWLYLSGRSGIHVGSRVEVGGVTGDVIDIGVLKTTMLEVGNLVLAPQASGRVVTVPNSAMVSASVFFNSTPNPFVWQEIRFTLTFGSDWGRAEAILREAGEEHHAQIAGEVERGYRLMERRYAFRTGRVTPIVYVSTAAHGVELTLRFLTHVRRRRGSVDTVTRRVLQRFAEEPNVRIAYPAYRIFREDGGGEERQ